MSDEVGVFFSPGPDWPHPNRWRRFWQRVDTAVTCNWFVIALRCQIKGHEWREESPTRCVRVTSCVYCGNYRGAQITGTNNCRWYQGPAAAVCDHPGIEHGMFSNTGVCPKCHECKFIGHGPLCGECYDEECS